MLLFFFCDNNVKINKVFLWHSVTNWGKRNISSISLTDNHISGRWTVTDEGPPLRHFPESTWRRSLIRQWLDTFNIGRGGTHKPVDHAASLTATTSRGFSLTLLRGGDQHCVIRGFRSCATRGTSHTEREEKWSRSTTLNLLTAQVHKNLGEL